MKVVLALILAASFANLTGCTSGKGDSSEETGTVDSGSTVE